MKTLSALIETGRDDLLANWGAMLRTAFSGGGTQKPG